jgi:ligand-binding sensor domain-containing protein
MLLTQPIFSLLIILSFLTSCGGQVKTNTPNYSVAKTKSIYTGQPKLIKTQGSKIDDEVRCSFQDKAGNLWFGTTGEGVYRYDGKLFTQFTIKDGLSSNSVWSVLEDNAGNILFGTTDGLCRYDGKNIISFPVKGNFISSTSSDGYYNDWSKKNTVWSMLQDRTGKIWFGTGDGIYCYDGKIFTRFLDNSTIINKNGLQLKMVEDILEDKYGNIWFASGMPPGGEGVCLYDGKSITRFKPNGENWFRYIVEEKNGNIWFGGRHNGNFLYDGKTFTNFKEKVGIGNSILADKAGDIWFTGEENDNLESVGGIWCYDGRTFKNFTTKDGMGKYFVWTMIEDKNGHIWIGTRNTGLYKYDGKTFTSFSE